MTTEGESSPEWYSAWKVIVPLPLLSQTTTTLRVPFPVVTASTKPSPFKSPRSMPSA